MNEPATTTTPQVVALLDDVAASTALLEISSALARLMQRDLSVVYVESQLALRAAALPFAQVLAAHASGWRPLQPGEVEQGFRAQAARLRELASRMALRHAVRCSLRVTRGSLGDAAADLQAGSDLLLLAGTPPFRPAVAPPRRRPVVTLIDDDGEAGQRARQVATQLAQSLSGVLQLAHGAAAAMQPGGAGWHADLLVLPRGALDARRLARLQCPVLLVG